nr:eukaryotic translation initiation factor 4e-1 [Quercus suber]
MSAEPVPLDTIPISPDGAMTDATNGTNGAKHSDGKIVSVFDDAENFNVKHQLQNSWTLWFTKPPSGKQDWNELLKEVITFDSVEEFWGIYNNITPASELAQKSDYHLFKSGVRPEWEDPQNKHGGRWAYTYKGGNKANDETWLNMMLAAIGETLEDDNDNEVMGVVVNIRKGFWRVGLWTRSAGQPPRGKKSEGAEDGEDGRKRLQRIGERFKKSLNLPPQEMVEFSGHADSAHSGSSRAKAKRRLWGFEPRPTTNEVHEDDPDGRKRGWGSGFCLDFSRKSTRVLTSCLPLPCRRCSRPSSLSRAHTQAEQDSMAELKLDRPSVSIAVPYIFCDQTRRGRVRRGLEEQLRADHARAQLVAVVSLCSHTESSLLLRQGCADECLSR